MSVLYFCKNAQQFGTIKLDELKSMIVNGELDDTTLVWKNGMSQWVRVRNHPELVSLIDTPPPLPDLSTFSSKSLLPSLLEAIRRKIRR